MPKLVVLSAGLSGRKHELNVDKTTIGRVEDNTFQIAESSVSSHHCEVLLQGSDVLIKDLNSTNGTFINGEKISESVLKPGQTLRLGQIELQLETEGHPVTVPPAPSPSAPPPPAASAPAAKKTDHTMLVPRGVSLNELSEGARPAGFDTTSKAFSKKTNKTNKWFLIGAAVIVVIVGIVFLVVLATVKK
jgi:pSer/pThr/pTyr-binding forkhead associated (FHA) protein